MDQFTPRNQLEDNPINIQQNPSQNESNQNVYANHMNTQTNSLQNEPNQNENANPIYAQANLLQNGPNQSINKNSINTQTNPIQNEQNPTPFDNVNNQSINKKSVNAQANPLQNGPNQSINKNSINIQTNSLQNEQKQTPLDNVNSQSINKSPIDNQQIPKQNLSNPTTPFGDVNNQNMNQNLINAQPNPNQNESKATPLGNVNNQSINQNQTHDQQNSKRTNINTNSINNNNQNLNQNFNDNQKESFPKGVNTNQNVNSQYQNPIETPQNQPSVKNANSIQNPNNTYNSSNVKNSVNEKNNNSHVKNDNQNIIINNQINNRNNNEINNRNNNQINNLNNVYNQNNNFNNIGNTPKNQEEIQNSQKNINFNKNNQINQTNGNPQQNINNNNQNNNQQNNNNNNNNNNNFGALQEKPPGEYNFNRYTKCAKVGLRGTNPSYLNSVLQCFNSIKSFANHNLKPKNMKFMEDNVKIMPLSFTISRLYTHFYPYPQENGNKSYELSAIKLVLAKFNEAYKSQKERNPITLLSYILEKLNDEYFKSDPKNKNKSININESNINKCDEKSVINHGVQNFNDKITLISKLFAWFELEKLKCSMCGKSTFNFEFYFTLDLDILGGLQSANEKTKNNNNNNIVTIYDCLNYFYKEKKKQKMCNCCHQITKIISKKRIFSPPNNFILTFNWLFENEIEQKQLNKINFQLKNEYVQLDGYIDKNIKDNNIYRIIGIVYYIGTLNKFISYYLSPVDGKWYSCHDEIVNDISFEEEIIKRTGNDFRNKPYILFCQAVG